MMSRAGSILSLLLAFCVYTAPAYAQEDTLFVDVEQLIKRRVESGLNRGIAVGIVDEQGTRVFFYGDKGRGAPIDEHTLFEIGSISKVFTTTVLAEMALEGTVHLDDPIDTYLPITARAPQRNGKQITLRHLATHYSGLPRLPTNRDIVNRKDPYAGYKEFDLLNFLSTYKLTVDPGSRREYSNYGMGLLGYLLGRIDSATYEQVIVNRVCSELGMSSTRVTLRPEMLSLLAQGHSAVGRPVSNWDLAVLAGAGGLKSSVEDMLVFLRANMGLMPTPLRAAMEKAHEVQYVKEEDRAWVGLGWQIRQFNGTKYHWHNGGTGGYRTFIGFSKEDKVGVVVLSNSASSVDDIGWHLLDQKATLARSYLGHKRFNVEFGLGTSDGNVRGPNIRASYIFYLDNYRILQVRPFVGYNRFELASDEPGSGVGSFAFGAVEMGVWFDNDRLLTSLLYPIFKGERFFFGAGWKASYFEEVRSVVLPEVVAQLPRWAYQSGGRIGYLRGRNAFAVEFWSRLRAFSAQSEFDDRALNGKQISVVVGHTF